MHRQPQKNCVVYGPNAVPVRIARSWFETLSIWEFRCQKCTSLWLPTDKMDAIFVRVDQDRHISIYDVEDLAIDHKTVLNHLKKKTG